jgi:protein TonB
MVPQRDAPQSYLWRVSGKRVSVALDLQVVDRIATTLSDADEHGGATFGGLLLGRTTGAWPSLRVQIEKCEPLQRASGASCQWQHDMERQLQNVRAKPGMPVVGFYHSTAHDDLAVTLEDVVFMSRHFQNEANVLLLIDGSRSGSPAAGFVIWENHIIRSREPYLRFPLSRAALAERAEPTGEAVALTSSECTGASDKPPSRGFLRRFSDRFDLEIRLGVAAAGVLALAMIDETRYAVPPETISQRPRAIRRVGPILPDTFASGWADSDVGEIGNATPLPASAGRDSGERRGGARRRPAAPIPPSNNRNKETALETPLPEAPHVDSRPPELAGGSASLIGSLPTVPAIVNPANRAVRIEVQPGRAATNRLLGKLIRRKRPVFVAPVALTNPVPELPLRVQQSLGRDVRIDVRVFVDAGGQVEYAELASNPADSTRELATWAVFAARKWRFSPATSDGAAVPSEATLRFDFAR